MTNPRIGNRIITPTAIETAGTSGVEEARTALHPPGAEALDTRRALDREAAPSIAHGGGTNPVLGARTAAIVPQNISPRVLTAIDRINTILVDELVESGESAAFSATGVMGLMMLAANGTSEGPQREAYLRELGLDGMSLDDVNAQARAIAAKFANLGDGAKVSTGNLVLTNAAKTGGFVPSFSEGVMQGLPTKVIDQPMGPGDYAAVADAVNDWAEESTGGLIEKFTNEAAISDTLWALMNAIAFDIEWLSAFGDASTLLENPDFDTHVSFDLRTREGYEFRQEVAAFVGQQEHELSKEPAEVRQLVEAVAAKMTSFTTGAGDVKDVDMMHLRTKGLRFVRGNEFRGVMLPSRGEGVYMVALLPNENVDAKSVLGQLDGEAFRDQIKAARPSTTDDVVRMPAFETEFEPGGVLGALEKVAPLAFDALTKNGPGVPNSAQLKAKVAVGREGAQGGQVVSMVTRESMVRPTTLEFNKPFAYAFVTKDGDPIMRGTFEG